MARYHVKNIVALALMLNCLLFSANNARPIQPVFIKQNEVFCTSNPLSVFCSKEEDVPTSYGNTDPYIEQLALVNKTVKAQFFNVKDFDDVWISFGERFIRDSSFVMKGDCEDLVMTSIEYAIHSGIPKNRLGRVIVISNPDYLDNPARIEIHMVAVYHSVETNKFYYFGDTLSNRIPVTTSSYDEPIYIDWLTDKYGWIVTDKIDLQ
jgi:hypothetical protein